MEYGDKPKSMERFCKNFERLPEKVKSRLTLENDDKQSMYSVKELYNGIYKIYACPSCLTTITIGSVMVGLSEQEALELAYQHGQKVLNQLSTIAKVAVPNNLTSQLDLKPILIMCTITLTIMVMTLIL